MATKKAETTKPKKETKPKQVKPKMVEKLELTYIYHEGDDLPEMIRAMTGHEYLLGTVLKKNGLTLNTIKEGDILRW